MLTMGTALSQQVDANWQTYIMIAVYFLILIVIGFTVTSKQLVT